MGPATSLEHFDLWIHARVEMDRRAPGWFQIRIEEAAHCVRGDGKLPAAVDPDQPGGAERSHDKVALQQRAIVAEQEVVRAADRNPQPPTGRLVVVNRLDVAADAARLRIGAMDLRAQEKHKRLLHAVAVHAASNGSMHPAGCPSHSSGLFAGVRANVRPSGNATTLVRYGASKPTTT